ncbi:MAG: thioredoxin family protein [Bacteroidetes bacterium]|nr:thioredoxin family protein [Bacteroidota bacterium]
MAVEISNDETYSVHLASTENVVIKYYADWCGICQLFSPKYKKLSTDERFKHILFLSINSEYNPIVRRIAGLDTLPFFAIFRNGVFVKSVSNTNEEKLIELLESL